MTVHSRASKPTDITLGAAAPASRGCLAGVLSSMHIDAPSASDVSAAPLCSVIVPLHNKAPYIAAALRSACAQTHPALEIIVVDDGSTDGSAAAARLVSDPRIRIESQVNQGVSRARNRAIELARGEFIFFLDADDVWHPQHMELSLAVFAALPMVALVGGDFFLHDESGADAHCFTPVEAVDVDLVDDLALMWVDAGRQRFCTPTTAVRTSALVGMKPWFPEDTSLAEDIHLWFRINQQAPLALIRQPLNVVRGGTPNSLTRRNEVDWKVPNWVALFESSIDSGSLRGTLARSWPQFVMRHQTTKALEMAAAGYRTAAALRLLAAWRYAAHPRWWGAMFLAMAPHRLQRRARQAWARRSPGHPG